MPKISKIKIYLSNGKMVPVVFMDGKYEIDSLASITDRKLRKQLLDIVTLLETF